MTRVSTTPRLQWERGDIERRLGFPAGKYTNPGPLLPLLIGVFLTVTVFLALLPVRESDFAAMFYERGWIPYFIVGLSCWSLGILFVKWRKLAFQKRALAIRILPEQPGFILSPDTVDIVLDNIEKAVDYPRRFVLFSRIFDSLSNLRNMGNITEVDDVLARQAEAVEDSLESGYGILKGFVWAIPVLGFIGTVLGLSNAIGSFGGVLAGGSDLDELKSGLQSVTGGLSIAFETTLLGLVAALLIQMLYTVVKRREEDFLDECKDYCHRSVVTRLRVLPLERNA